MTCSVQYSASPWASRYESLSLSALTFALKALPEQSSKKPLAVLAHRRPCVRVDRERVGHLHLAHQDLVQMNGSACVEAPSVTRGPWLAEQTGSKDYQ